jgi:hypothetical protein
VAELILLARAVYQANIRLGNLTSTALKLESPYIMELYQSISSSVVGADVIPTSCLAQEWRILDISRIVAGTIEGFDYVLCTSIIGRTLHLTY